MKRRDLPYLIPFAFAAGAVCWFFSHPSRLFGAGFGRVFLLLVVGVVVIAAVVAVVSVASSSESVPIELERAAARAGACGFCGTYSSMLASHEAGHVAAARSLGYAVPGAVISKEGWGYTDVPGWLNNPWHTMVIAAAGAAGENRDRWTDAGLNGSPSWTGSDAWWVHKLAPAAARKRGVTVGEVIALARSEADRRVASRSGDWRDAKVVLKANGVYGRPN
jgi:hypothetical protein